MADSEDFSARLGKALKARDVAAEDLSQRSFEAFQGVWDALDRLDAEVKKAIPGSEFKRNGDASTVAQGMCQVVYFGKNADGIGRHFRFLIKDANLITLEGMDIEGEVDDFIESSTAFGPKRVKEFVAHVERDIIGWLSAPRPKRLVRLYD